MPISKIALRDPVTENLTRKCYHIATENTNNIPMEDLNMKAKFYICEHCGNLVTTIHNAGVPLVCCGEKMKELLPNTVEASGEKGTLFRTVQPLCVAGSRRFCYLPEGSSA